MLVVSPKRRSSLQIGRMKQVQLSELGVRVVVEVEVKSKKCCRLGVVHTELVVRLGQPVWLRGHWGRYV